MKKENKKNQKTYLIEVSSEMLKNELAGCVFKEYSHQLKKDVLIYGDQLEDFRIKEHDFMMNECKINKRQPKNNKENNNK